jgi:drug/metabolite transporter (DMT)-like permease
LDTDKENTISCLSERTFYFMLFFLSLTGIALLCLCGGSLLGYRLSYLRSSQKRHPPASQEQEENGQSKHQTPSKSVWQQIQRLSRSHTLRSLFIFAGFVVVNLLYASFAMVATGILQRIDPLIFTCGQILCVLPVALFFLIGWRRALTQAIVLHGMLFGCCLAFGFLCIALALRAIGITESAVLTCLEGIVAAGISWGFFRQRLATYTWGACLLAIIGAILLWSSATVQWQGDLIALLGGIHFMIYAFLVEHLLPADPQVHRQILWPTFGVQLTTMAVVTLIFALAFGRWQSLPIPVPGSDLAAMMYAGLGTVVVPVLLSTFLFRSTGAVTASFFSILEPLSSGLFAFLVAQERLPALAYVGSGCILLGMVLQAVAGMSSIRSDVTCSPELPDESNILAPLSTRKTDD